MKWIDNTPVKGEQRTRAAFLTTPMQIGREVRWLEKAEWVEEFGYESQIRARQKIEEMKRQGVRDCPTIPPTPISRTGPKWIPLFWHNVATEPHGGNQ